MRFISWSLYTASELEIWRSFSDVNKLLEMRDQC
uniref:GSVIVT01029976001 n=1 Tax=Arundo donax TaxID=35708 RepID=A0A0A9GBZ0_ARUDO